MAEELSTSSAPSQEESASSSGADRTRPKQGHGSRAYANFWSAIASIGAHRRSSLLAVSGVFIGAMVVMASAIVIQSTTTLFSLALYGQVIQILLVGIGGVSFVAGGLILMNMLLMEGVERSREFGMRLVIGARRRDIRNQLLFEALLLSVSGGVSGSACGVLIGFVLTSLLHLSWSVQPIPLVLLVSASVVSGTLGGVYPAVRVSRQTLEV